MVVFEMGEQWSPKVAPPRIVATAAYGSNACPPNGAMGQNLVSIFLGTVYSPCGSRCGSNHFQNTNEGRTSDNGKLSLCALSRS